MRPPRLYWKSSRRDALHLGQKPSRWRAVVQGGLASVLAVAGLVVFATEASAHNNYFQSVTGACNSTPGTGATLTWTLYNDWNEIETGTFSTSQGTLSTLVLSIAASPTMDSSPPAAAHQTFTQTLTASELGALSPSSTISVGWTAKWSDGTPGSGTLTTTLSALNLPNGCVPPKTTPTIATTLVPPSSTAVGHSWSDSAIVTGSAGGAAPAGSVHFYVCQSSTSSPSSSTCATGGSLVGTVSSPSSLSGNASTYNLSPMTYTPPNVGTYCYYTTYTPTSGEYYLTASGPAECFGVNPAYPGIMTTLVAPSSTTVGNAWSDSATVNGVFGGGTPLGSVKFYTCQASTSPTSSSTCADPAGTLVGTVSTPSTSTSVSATYNLEPTTYTPTSVGTYCFYTLYSPSTTNYLTVWGPSECFGVYPAGTHTTTHTSADVIVIGGTAYDTATVSGDSSHGVPTGTVTFYSCVATSSAGCTGGTEIPGTAGTPDPAPLSGSGSFTATATSPTIMPSAAGTYCFGAVFNPDGTKYSTSSDDMSGDVVTDECFSVGQAYPGIKTTLVTPSSTSVGNAWSDSATVNGVYGGGAPLGSVTFYTCQASTSPTSSSTCTDPTGTPIGTVSSPSTSTSVSATYNLAPTSFTPTSVGTYCFYTLYSPSTANYFPVWGPSECFGVTPATPTIATTVVPPSSPTVGNAWSDSATVTGNTTGGPPLGSVSFSVCQASSSPTSSSTCVTGGTPVGTVSSPSSSSGDASTYNLAPTTYTPTSVGTYCFYTTYAPAEVDNYTAASGPAECFSVMPATPTILTTLVPPSSPTVGNAWSDSATVTGNTTGGAPLGSVSFSVCQASSSPSSSATCDTGGSLVGTVSSPSSSSGDASTYNLAPTTYTPTSVGTYCFYTVYAPAEVDNYAAASGPAECFSVTPADPQLSTQQSGSHSGSGTIALGGSVTDTATVTGNSIGGAPTGTVTFTECATGSSPAVCPSGTAVGSPVTLNGTGNSSTATSAAFTPSAAGTYCFAAVYTPDTGSNYVGADDNMSGTVSATECLSVTAVVTAASTVTPTTTTTVPPTTTPATTPAIAFTGALLSQEWLIGLGALLLGAGLVVAARWRRRSPKHAAK